VTDLERSSAAASVTSATDRVCILTATCIGSGPPVGAVILVVGLFLWRKLFNDAASRAHPPPDLAHARTDHDRKL